MTLYEFIAAVGTTQTAMAKQLNTTRYQIWRWQDYVVLSDGRLINPRALRKIDMAQFDLKNLNNLSLPGIPE